MPVLTLSELGVKFVEWLIAIPAVRTFLEAIMIKIGADVYHEIFCRADTDPAFQQQYLALSLKLRQATTIKEKQDAIAQIQALRRS